MSGSGADSRGRSNSTPPALTDQKAVYNVLEYLNSLKSSLSEDSAAVLDKATKDIGDLFGVSVDDPGDFKNFSYYTVNTKQLLEAGIHALGAPSYSEAVAKVEHDANFEKFMNNAVSKGIFDNIEPDSVEYLQRHAKVVKKYREKVTNTADDRYFAMAEEKKNLGNAAQSAQDYHGAIAYYTEALDLCSKGPNSHIYYCNRAAAYEKLNEFSESVADCENAIELCPEYSKSYARLGNSRFKLKDYEGAVSAYEEAVRREPDNEGSKKSLEVARKKLLEENKKSKTVSSALGLGGGTAGGSGADISQLFSDPNFSLFNNSMVKEVIDKFGTQPSMQNLMKDPDTMAMAQKIFSNPQALQQVMQMAGSMNGGDGASLANLASLAGQKGIAKGRKPGRK